MVVKRLVDAVVFGFGASAGAKLLENALAGEPEAAPPTEAEKAAAARAAEAEARQDAKRKAAEAQRALAAARAQRAQHEAEIDDELAALKRKLGK